jgi:type II secretory pathway component PulF
MAHYSYKAKDSSGTPVEGVVEANDQSGAARAVQSLGYIPILIQETTKTILQPSKGNKSRFNFELGFQRQPKMKLQELLLFSRELSDLVASGMTIGRALHTLSNRKDKGTVQQIITTLRDEIVQGTSLSDALELYPDTFSTLYINLVRAGEASGHLPGALENVCVHYERVQEARSKVTAALVYPSIVLIIGGLAVLGLMIGIVPKFVGTFEDMGATLPKPTLVLMNASQFLIQYGIVLVAIIAGITFMIKKWLATESGKTLWHRYQLKVPILGAVIRTNAFAHFSRTFGTLLKNGVSVLPALGIVQKTINNVVIAKEIGETRTRVTDGASISKPLSKSKIFPSLLIDMLAVGEETGDMPGALSHITRRYDTELDRLVKTCTTVLEPLLIVLVAFVVGGIAICLLLPVLTLTDSLHV